jgi:hypothetical protein
MGDRGNIHVYSLENPQGMYFYTHWDGPSLPRVLQAALERGRSRWDDEAYLNRIIFSEMIQNHVLDTTGYGLATCEQDQNHPTIHVNHTAQTVHIGNMNWLFEDFVEQKFN